MSALAVVHELAVPVFRWYVFSCPAGHQFACAMIRPKPVACHECGQATEPAAILAPPKPELSLASRLEALGPFKSPVLERHRPECSTADWLNENVEPPPADPSPSSSERPTRPSPAGPPQPAGDVSRGASLCRDGCGRQAQGLDVDALLGDLCGQCAGAYPVVTDTDHDDNDCDDDPPALNATPAPGPAAPLGRDVPPNSPESEPHPSPPTGSGSPEPEEREAAPGRAQAPLPAPSGGVSPRPKRKKPPPIQLPKKPAPKPKVTPRPEAVDAYLVKWLNAHLAEWFTLKAAVDGCKRLGWPPRDAAGAELDHVRRRIVALVRPMSLRTRYPGNGAGPMKYYLLDPVYSKKSARPSAPTTEG